MSRVGRARFTSCKFQHLSVMVEAGKQWSGQSTSGLSDIPYVYVRDNSLVIRNLSVHCWGRVGYRRLDPRSSRMGNN